MGKVGEQDSTYISLPHDRLQDLNGFCPSILQYQQLTQVFVRWVFLQQARFELQVALQMAIPRPYDKNQDRVRRC